MQPPVGALFNTVDLPQNSVAIRTHASCTRRSHVVSHATTFLAQCCLTSLHKWELVSNENREMLGFGH